MTLKSVVTTMLGKLTQKPAQKHQEISQFTPYQLIGGENAVRKLANCFYDIMQNDVNAKDLLAIHPQPMLAIRQKFFEYLSGWLGGPALYESKYGHPRLRARHLPYSINSDMRDQWMYCMNLAMDEVIDNAELKKSLHTAFYQLANHMINQDN
jgi:hemoglobin